MIIGVDVDGTVVDSVTPWLDELLPNWKEYDLEYRNGSLNVQLANILGKSLDEVLEYWKTISYQSLKPINGCVEKLEELSKFGTIVFVTTCVQDHMLSKMKFLDEHFPFHGDIISAKRKDLIKLDVMIEDNLSVLSTMKDVEKRLIFTGVSGQFQPTLQTAGFPLFSDWETLTLNAPEGM